MNEKRPIAEIVAENIATLRKNSGLTQTQFAEKINYSDNTVSRWEHGEITPNLETLEQIAELFEVPIEYIIHEHSAEEMIADTELKARKMKRLQIMLFLIAAVWFCTIALYFCFMTFAKINPWVIFVWAVPVSCMPPLIYSEFMNTRIYPFTFITIAVWSLLAAIYIQFLPYNIYLIFIVGVPVEHILVTWAFVTKKNKRKKDK
ncbi:MAG: helix-turn-helix transcriptional regulator [Clostridia bacterium]|nr:helix-turn-helix transcriptional regulator [Clostridia bacterium]